MEGKIFKFVVVFRLEIKSKNLALKNGKKKSYTVEPLNFYTLQKKTFCPKNVNNEKKIENLKKL